MSEWLDLDEMVKLVCEMAKANGLTLSKHEATAFCLKAIRDGHVPLYNPQGQQIEIPELADAAFLDDIVAEVEAKHRLLS